MVGLISDTHGLLRPAAVDALSAGNVSQILHAGDVDNDDILAELALIAPVQAVAGNCDPPDNPLLPRSRQLELGGLTLHMSHGHELGVPTPQRLRSAYAADVIIFGHTHRPQVVRGEDGRLVVNPGAAGPRRFDIRASLAILTIEERQADVKVIYLDGD
ncbi:MAG: metallophosphoesterase family protein [Gemmatimonadota bacterium]